MIKPPRDRKRLPKGSAGFAEKEQNFAAQEKAVHAPAPGAQTKRLWLGPGGRVVIPAEFRKAMEIEQGDPLTAILEDGELRLVGMKVAVRKAQAMVRKYVPEGISLADELIADRRREEKKERDG